MQTREALRNVPLFAALPAHDLSALANIFVERTYDKSSPVESDIRRDPVLIGVILRGDAEWRSSNHLINLWEGSSFGDWSTENRFDATVTIIPRRSATIALLTRSAVLQFFSRHADAALSLIGALVGQMRRPVFSRYNNDPRKMTKATEK